MKLLARIKRQRQWRREHIVAFSHAVQVQSDGLSRFQHQALLAIAEFISPEQFRRVAMTNDEGTFLVGEIAEIGAELYIYPNEVAIVGRKPDLRFEEWDYRTPEELLAAVVQQCAERIAMLEEAGAR